MARSGHSPTDQNGVDRLLLTRVRVVELMLEGKVALVTGASKGIGRAIAATYAAAGARVMLSSRKQDALDEAASTMDGETATFAANAGEPDQAQACVEATMARFGRVDILVNNAATNPYQGPLLGIDQSRADKTVKVNQTGLIFWTQAAWNASMQEHGGVVLNVASIGGMRAGESIGWYNVTKAAVIHLTTQLARELAPKVRVNALAPGLVKTDMARALWEPAEEAIAKRTPLRRLGEPQDIANAALFLASDASSWITGQTLAIDGGALLSGNA
jgi:NAD(P)-dependent dehydrogenase (short-subunit alcohol dehydrogenase family)